MQGGCQDTQILISGGAIRIAVCPPPASTNFVGNCPVHAVQESRPPPAILPARWVLRFEKPEQIRVKANPTLSKVLATRFEISLIGHGRPVRAWTDTFEQHQW
jgi:hypothetical protein